MQPIDRPFRPTWDFCAVWALLALAAFFLTRHRTFVGPWYSRAALVTVVSLFGTFILYGPVLLARQVIRSGPRGWAVLRVFVSAVLAAALLLGSLWLTGQYTETRARVIALLIVMGATLYLSAKPGR